MQEALLPYGAIIGQEKAKQALLLLAVNEQLQSVLLAGEGGTGKTWLARGFAALLPLKRRVDIPLNITDDRLWGSIDLEYALKAGEKTFQPGLLAVADGNIVIVDDIHLMADAHVHAIVQAISTREVEVEREGYSVTYPANGLLVATMNLAEGELSAGVLDQFGLYVPMQQERELDRRIEIIRISLAYEHDPELFIRQREVETVELLAAIAKAKTFMCTMKVSEQIMELAALTTLHAHCRGHRADFYLVEAAKAIAALEHRDEVEANDIRLAAEYVLIHRMRSEPASEPQEDSQREQQDNSANGVDQPTDNQPASSGHDAAASPPQHPNPMDGTQPPQQDPANSDSEADEQSPTDAQQSLDIVETIGQAIQANRWFLTAKDDIVRTGTGKRSKTKSGTKQGRYVKAAYAKGNDWDIAFDATLRAAAPFQRMRPTTGETVWTITKEDIREKVREKRVGVTMLFVVDASRSMAANKRMQAVKGAIFALLQDAYQKRDRVGMIAFRQDKAEEMLPVTRSIQLAKSRLGPLPTGGKTPLVFGLKKGYELLRQAMLRDAEIVPVMIVVTDGKANVGLQQGAAIAEILEESRRVGSEVHAAGIQSLIIDTEEGFVRLHQAKALAHAMKAQYVQLEELDGNRMAQTIRSLLKL